MNDDTLREKFYGLTVDQLREFGVDVDGNAFLANRFGVLIWKKLGPLVHQYAQAYAESIIGEDNYPQPGYRVLRLSQKHRNDLRIEQRTLNNERGGKL